MNMPQNAAPALRLMTYSQWLEANPEMKNKKAKRVPCLACCDKWGYLLDRRKTPCDACGDARTVMITPLDIYKKQIAIDRARLTKAGIEFIDVQI